ncbi:MAG: TolC family protein [Chitinophagales bacterium]|nr:TolC family protein [Chitinophagaceae bacterium]MCB9065881.1 TolC family protein [Chitinophagales bacterium]
MKHVSKALILILLLATSFNYHSYAQDDSWSLKRSVRYALEHNITIQQNELNKRLAKLTLTQSRLSQLPNVNANTNYGRSFGRSVDPTTNQFVDNTSYDFMSIGGSADVLVFGWFQRRNRISQNKYNLRAAEVDLEQIMNDVSLNVATGYLRLLLAKEQIKINEQQAALSKAQLEQTTQFVEAGRLPELNVAQLEAQLASDSANLISALTEYNAAVLDIKAILNLDFETPFEPEVPTFDIEKEIETILVDPETVYLAAEKNLGTVRSNELRLIAAKKGYWAAKGALLPVVALNAQAGTNYSTTFKDYNLTGGYTESRIFGSYAYDSTSKNRYDIYQLQPQYTTSTIPLGKQLDNNFRQTVSIGVNIPLFNGWQSQTALKQAKINMMSQQLNLRQSELKLRQDVYKAHNDAKNAVQKYYAAKRSADAAKRAYDFAQKRNELGLTNTIEYLVTQNNYAKASGNLASAKYDLVFKLKVIDYYLGNEIKL